MNIIERIEYALKKAKENVFEKHIPVQDTDIDSVLVDAMLEIKELKQQVSELHASRESLLEYKGKIESDDYVLVPRMPTKNMLDAGFVDGDYGCSTLKIYKAIIEAVEKENAEN